MRCAGIVIAMSVALGGRTEQVLLKPEWGVVLTEEQAKVFWQPRLCNRPAPGPIQEIWIPDDATVRRLEAALGPALQEASTVPPSPRTNPTRATSIGGTPDLSLRTSGSCTSTAFTG